MDGGAKELSKGEQIKYGQQLLPQSIYDNPYAEHNHAMADDTNLNNPTPPPHNTTHRDPTHATETQPDIHHTSQNTQEPDSTEPKTRMDNDLMRGIKYPPLSAPGPS
eukprot:13529722-Heterocapsa_arctica.AAC.1